jgi:glycerol-3-phosphate cytidylyltransferase
MLVLPDNMHGKRVGFTCSTFDLLHAGHILMLAEAKNICDHLIVAVQTDPTIDRGLLKNKPVQSIVERYVQLSAVKFVDQIIVYETEKDLEDLLMFLPISIRIIGEEYKDKDFTGKVICEERGIKMWYNSRSHRFSSSELRKRTYQSEQLKEKSYTERYNVGIPLRVYSDSFGTVRYSTANDFPITTPVEDSK